MYVKKENEIVIAWNGPSLGRTVMLESGWILYAGTLPTSRLDIVDGAVIELPEPGPTSEWVPISAFIGALYALIPAEQVAAVMQNEAALKPALAGLALLSSDAAPGGMIDLLDQRVSEWLALVNLTLDQVREQMTGGEA